MHYVSWQLDTAQTEAFAAAEVVTLELDHPQYQHVTVLDADTRAELLADLRG